MPARNTAPCATANGCRGRPDPIGGLVGDSHDNALAECTIGLLKTELVGLHGPWHTATATELVALEYIDWCNTARLHGELAHRTPREIEQAHYRHTLAQAGARSHS